MSDSKSDKIIWWIMVTAVAFLISGATAWAYNINMKVDKIAGLEVNVQNIQENVKDIKSIIQIYLRKMED